MTFNVSCSEEATKSCFERRFQKIRGLNQKIPRITARQYCSPERDLLRATDNLRRKG